MNTTTKRERLTAADLSRLGFNKERNPNTPAADASKWFRKGACRVVLDTDGIEVYCFGPHDALDWKCTFDAYAPADVVKSTLLKIIGG